MEFARRCKRKTGLETYNLLNAVNGNYTVCGKGINGMWFIQNSVGMGVDDVTCKKCLKSLKLEMKMLGS